MTKHYYKHSKFICYIYVLPTKAILFKFLDIHKLDWLLIVLNSFFANEDKPICKSDWLLELCKNLLNLLQNE